VSRVNADFVMAAAEALQEGVASADHRRSEAVFYHASAATVARAGMTPSRTRPQQHVNMCEITPSQV
jgi:hypothetical protein